MSRRPVLGKRALAGLEAVLAEAMAGRFDLSGDIAEDRRREAEIVAAFEWVSDYRAWQMARAKAKRGGR